LRAKFFNGCSGANSNECCCRMFCSDVDVIPGLDDVRSELTALLGNCILRTFCQRCLGRKSWLDDRLARSCSDVNGPTEKSVVLHKGWYKKRNSLRWYSLLDPS
jgi:hypothetical protein